jgi:hypothetical protein
LSFFTSFFMFFVSFLFFFCFFLLSIKIVLCPFRSYVIDSAKPTITRWT